jgi:hypothetical protein
MFITRLSVSFLPNRSSSFRPVRGSIISTGDIIGTTTVTIFDTIGVMTVGIMTVPKNSTGVSKPPKGAIIDEAGEVSKKNVGGAANGFIRRGPGRF